MSRIRTPEGTGQLTCARSGATHRGSLHYGRDDKLGLESTASTPSHNSFLRFCTAATICRRLLRPRAGGFGSGFSRGGLWCAGEGRSVSTGWNWWLYLRSTYEAVNASTVYDLASITKVIATTSMAMLLYQRGQLSLDQPLGEILPAFIQSEAAGERAASGDATHAAGARSGLPGYARLFEVAGGARNCSMPAFTYHLKPRPEAGRVLRSWIHFAGRALEVLAGDSLEDFCGREVFTPLGMTSTCFRPPADWRSSIPPTEEDLTFRHRVIQGEVQDENCFVLGGEPAMPASSPMHWIRCFMRNACSTSSSSRAETVRLFTTRAAAGGQFPGAGMGYTFPALLLGQILQPPFGGPSRLRGNLPLDRLRTQAGHRAAHQSHLAASQEPGHSCVPSRLPRRELWKQRARIKCHNPKVFVGMARYALISEQSIVTWR